MSGSIFCAIFHTWCVIQASHAAAPTPKYVDQIEPNVLMFRAVRNGIDFSKDRPTMRVRRYGKELDIYGLGNAVLECGVTAPAICEFVCYYNQAEKTDVLFWQSCLP